jgi:hypothetical protein
MGILVNFVDRFFKRLQNGVSNSFLEMAENSELHPDVIASMKGVQDNQDRLNEVINKLDLTKPEITKVTIENKIKYKERKEIIKQVKLLFEEYFIKINDKKIKKTEIIEYLKTQHNKSDLFCEEFLENYKDRIFLLKYKKELSDKHKIIESKKIKDKNKIKVINEKYDQVTSAKILNGEYWKGMTKSMLVESLGYPGEKKEDIFKEKVKMKFYYNKKKNKMGNWSYSLEISLEDGVVVGWKDLDIVSKRVKLISI